MRLLVVYGRCRRRIEPSVRRRARSVWMVQRPGAAAEFVVATRFGPRTVASFEELLSALDVVGEPSEFSICGLARRYGVSNCLTELSAP